ncbi:MAG TPA: hypothetical protein VFP72_03550 [Kineosporiaceae bacterium]|nr:hypothetical protein [Kineosporiaceae bacterium]
MRAVQLIGARVVDRDGQVVGTVHDLRLVAGPHAHGLIGYRLDTLITGTAGVGDRLGYATGDVRGPWPLPWLFSRLARRVLLVPWRDVVAVEGRVIRIRSSARQLRSLRDGGGDPGARDDVAGQPE